MMALDIISSVLGICCVFLAGRGSKYNFWVGYLYTAALFLLFLQRDLYANLLLQPVSLAINIAGHYRWTHPSPQEQSSDKSLKVTSLDWGQRAIAVVSVLIVAFGWGFLLDRLFPQDPHPYLDSVVTVLILTAQLLSALKKWDCWIVWLLVNVSQIVLHASVGNVFMAAVSGIYLINGIWSLYSWKKRCEQDSK